MELLIIPAFALIVTILFWLSASAKNDNEVRSRMFNDLGYIPKWSIYYRDEDDVCAIGDDNNG